jgi:hypothetical protein
MKLSGHIRSTHNHDGAVVLDILHGQMYRLNFVGSRMLELLREGFSEEQIVLAISQETGAARDIVSADLREFLVHLEKHRFFEAAEPGRRSVL